MLVLANGSFSIQTEEKGPFYFCLSVASIYVEGEQLTMGEILQKKARKEMLTYIITLTLIVMILFGAVYAHLSFGLHRITKTSTKVNDVARTAHLHDLIFSKY